MLFNSIEFAIFLPIVFLLYWFVLNKNLKLQNTLLLLASYFFYGWWDWRFLFLLVFISCLNYFIGLRIEINEINRKKKNWLIIGLIFNIGILSIFKYYNFFVDSFINLISFAGYDLPKSTTKIILPLGISFYVFLSLSYIIDIYKQNLKANRNIIEVLLTLSFFPIILAGPIQCPSSLLPQIIKNRDFNYTQAKNGLRQILWGLFAKVVIADNLALSVDNIFSNISGYSGNTLAMGAAFYTIQIYADFSGYSNIAIGIAKLLGFNLMQNFAYPYFSRDIREFWKRWHISMVTWFRDYLFFPISFTLSGRIRSDKVLFIRSDLFIYIVASAIVWFLTGLWHGANYTFVLWGMIHGFFLIIYQLQKKPRKKILKKIGISNKNYFIVIVESFITLFIVMITWVIFRSDNINQAYFYISNIFSPSLFLFPHVFPKKVILITMIFILSEWVQRDKLYALQIENIKNRIIRWAMYYAIIIAIFYFAGKGQQFIYFQF
jgi:alginate O-acetyltransferase complex protein AlgI